MDWALLMTQDTTRIAAAVAVLAVLALICLWATLRRKKGDEVIPVPQGSGQLPAARDPVLVLYASQTGQAETIARRTANSLAAGGHPVALLSLKAVTAENLQQARRALCVVSTAGEGDAPDEALRFEHTLMKTRVELGTLSFAVLALGDRTHGHFCAFGHKLDAWLMMCGARQIKPCIEVDDLDPAALARWEAFLGSLGAGEVTSDGELFTDWRLKDRQVLNADSKAQKLVQVDLVPVTAGANWQAGDLIEIITPKGHRRDYSIASLPQEGQIRLLVRQKENGDGSRLLTHGLAAGETLKLRIKTHENFHTPPGNGPLLLIGAGSGLAGLRSHLLTARAARRPCWVIYGERNPVTDGAACDELILWHDDGSLTQLDLAFSSVSNGQGRYVQDVLVGRTGDLKDWLSPDGAVLVCGGLDMGKAIDAALRRHMSDAWVDEAVESGRYRRDLY